MDFCITRVDDATGTLLRIDGRLGRDGIGELARACEAATRPLTIDLSGLRLANDAAIEALCGVEAAGAKLVGASPYLALRLESARSRRLESKKS
jgi:hypothetical protein